MFSQVMSVLGQSRLTGWPTAVAAAAIILVLLVWQIVSLVFVGQGKFIEDSSLRLRASAASEVGMGLEQVAALHLFGDTSISQVNVPPPPTDMPKTNLKLVLVGAMSNSDPKKASALIGADNQTRRYFVGDNVAGGAVLHEVLSDSVVLQRDGRYETLFFPRTSEVPAVTPASKVNRVVSPSRAGSVGEIKIAPAGDSPGAGNLTLRERLQSGQPNSENR